MMYQGLAGQCARITCTVLAVWTIMEAEGQSTNVTRGPYAQLGTPTSIVIRWRTDVATTSAVRYGTARGALDHSVTGSSVATDHVISITGLQANHQYYYQLGTLDDWFPVHPNDFFVTAPPIGTAVPTRIWVIGDSETANASARSVRDAYLNFTVGRYTDVWLLQGDSAYVSGTDAEFQAAFFDMYPMLLQNTVVWPTRGNHESDADGGTYYNIFTMPINGEVGGVASGTEAYYSFDFGNIHFICLDSVGSDLVPTGSMATWLTFDLASTTLDWIIAYWHHPPYSKGSHDSDVESGLAEMRENIVPILEAGGADLILSGHSHGYERSFLIDGHYGASDTQTPWMILDGGDGREGGTGAYNKPTRGIAEHERTTYVVAGSSGKVSASGSLDHPVMYTSVRELGSMVIDIFENRLDAKFLRETGAIDDYFTIIKGAESVPAAPASLTATSDDSQITLAWAPSFGATSYNIKRAEISGGPYPVIATSATSEFGDYGLTNGTAYYYLVTGNNEQCESAPSQELMAIPNIAPVVAVFTPTDDAQVKSSSPTNNYGSEPTLRGRDGGSSTTYHSYLKFNVSGIQSPITSATLRLFVADASNDGGHFFNGYCVGSIHN